MNHINLFLLFIFMMTYNSLTSQAIYRCENDNTGSRIIGRGVMGSGTTGLDTIHQSEFTGIGPRSITIDNINHKIYWTNLGEGTLNRSDIDGSFKEVLISEDYQPFDIVLSHNFNKIYWTDLSGLLLQSDFDGSNIEILLENQVSSPTDLFFHDELGTLFWLENHIIKSLEISSGTVQVIITTNNESINDFTVDKLNGKILWSEELSGNLKRANLDGSEIETLYNPIAGRTISSIAADPNNYDIYFIEADSVKSYLWEGDVWGSSRLLLNSLEGNYWGLALSSENLPTAIENSVRIEGFSFYPNPTNDELTIKLSGINLNSHSFIEVIDIHGKTLISSPLRSYSSQLMLSNIIPANYLIAIRSGGKIISSKMFSKL